MGSGTSVSWNRSQIEPSPGAPCLPKQLASTIWRPFRAPTAETRLHEKRDMAAIELTIDGTREAVEAPTHRTLLEHLRLSGRVGTKEGCAEGDCGACTVAVVAADADGERGYRAVNSCLVPLAALAGRTILTVEGGSRRRPPPRAGGDGRTGRVAVRLLHSRLRDEYVQRLLPERAAAGGRDRRGQSVPLHRLPADPPGSSQPGACLTRRPAPAFASRVPTSRSRRSPTGTMDGASFDP